MFDGFSANLVNTGRGNLAFGLTDLYLQGRMPIVFQRSYVSDRREDIGLGVGWSFVFADRINVEGDAATLTDMNGTLAFQRDGQSQRFVLQVNEPGIHQQFEMAGGETIIERAGDVTRTYEKIGAAYHLSQITLPGGLSVLITHDAAGRIIRAASDPGGSLTYQWSEGKDARLLGVVDSAGRRVAFRQDGHRLRAVVDLNGSVWNYDYTNSGLSKAVDPMGRVLLRTRYDRFDRVTESGDAVGSTRYDYDFGGTSLSRRTVVTDPLGAVTVYEQTDRGALAVIKDDEGRSARLEYNVANRPVRISDSSGVEITFGYDAQNRLLDQSNNGTVDRAYSFGADGRLSSIVEGTERTDLTFDGRGQVIAAQSTDPGRSYAATYDSRGGLTRLKSKEREVLFEYDGLGNETAQTYSDVGRFSNERDAAGRVAASHLPSGLSFFNEYDTSGAFIKQSDNRGNAVTVQRDASGAPIAYIRADGKQMRAVRDDVGRVIRDTDYDGNVRTFAYDARGGLTDSTIRGKHRKYQYDHRGRLSAIVDDDGATRKVERDGRGQIRRLSYSPIASLSPLRLQARSFRSSVDRSWAHAPALQDPPPGCCDDPIITDIWAPYWPSASGGGSGGNYHPPLEEAPGEGGGGGMGETRAQCISRHTFNCHLGFAACLLATTGVFLGVFAGCTLSTFILGAPACAVLADVILVLGAGACVLYGYACLNAVQDGCPS
jgi:YD repeat-containing protein